MSLNSIQVWIVDLSTVEPRDYDRFWPMLSPDEIDRAQRFRFEHHRQAFVARRAILRSLLSDYLNQTAAQIKFHYSSHGKPIVESGGIHFNLSHSTPYAVYALSQACELGIDIEKINPDMNIWEIVDRYFKPEEQAYLKEISPTLQQETFFRYWTCKEAYLKAIGSGIGDLEQARIDLRMMQVQSSNAEHWYLWESGQLVDYRIAIVHREPKSVINLTNFSLTSI